MSFPSKGELTRPEEKKSNSQVIAKNERATIVNTLISLYHYFKLLQSSFTHPQKKIQPDMRVELIFTLVHFCLHP